MKIVKLEDFHADGGWQDFSFLKITTDEGLVGWSEFNEARGQAGLTGIIRSLGKSVIGEDPREINRIDAMLASQTRLGGLQSQALAAIENACLDISAKALGVPVYQMLGGAVRQRLPVYWSHCALFRARYGSFFGGRPIDRPEITRLEDLVELGREVKASGFKALKTNILVFDGKGGVRAHNPGQGRGVAHPDRNITIDEIDAAVDQMSALREGAGPGVRLMLDLNFHFKPEGYKILAKKLEPLDLLWLEMDSYEPEALSLIRQTTSTPISSLEAVLGRRNLRPYLEKRSVDVAIIDVEWNGLVESLRMASMADAYDVNVASHTASGPLSTIVSAHFGAVVPNFRIMEYDVDEIPWRQKLLTNPCRIENGEFLLPTGPGWGTEIDEEVLHAHPPRR